MLPVKATILPTVSRFFDDDWNSLFNWSDRVLTPSNNTLPAVNIRENEEEFLVEVFAPGMKKDDFRIELQNNLLTISTEIEHESEETKNNHFRLKEYSFQSFRRLFNLNNRVVDDANIKATYEGGILNLTLPKKEEAKDKPSRIIEIS